MNYVKHINLFGVEAKEIPCITGSGAPTNATEGAVGSLYMDTQTAKLYKCVYVANGSYYWSIDSAAPTFDTTASGSVATVKDAVSGQVKYCAVNGAATKITRLGSNFFDGQLVNGFYANENMELDTNYTKFRSFTIQLPKGKYSICSNIPLTIVKRKINGEFTGEQITYVTAYGFAVNSLSDVSFSFRRADNTEWTEDIKVWIARGTEGTQYANYQKQEVSVADASQLTLLHGENYIFTDNENATVSISYVADGALYMADQLQGKDVSKIASLIRNGEISKIKLIGDSITQGVGGTGFQETYGDGNIICDCSSVDATWKFRVNTTGTCWANSFKHYIETKYPNVSVDCWGTRGLSTETWLNIGYYDNGRLVNCLEQLISDEDDLVICMIGTNDRTHRANIEEFSFYMQQVVEYILGRGKKLLLMSSIPASLENETNGTQKFHMEDVNNLICHFANSYGVWFVSLYNAMTQYLRNSGTELSAVLKDGLHPNDTGYDLMYQFVLEGIGFGAPIDGATWL